MATWLEVQRQNGTIDKIEVLPRGEFGIAQGDCPSCGVPEFALQGHGIEQVDEETIRAACRCFNCNDPVGYVYHRESTIFGREEDERVLRGRCRVY